jgi:L-alanine-DL-glutamate epimerase-like enolase superfamily enzyme
MNTASRRSFLAGAAISGLAGAAALPAAQAGRSALPNDRISPLDGVKREKIKITDIKVMNLGYRLKPEEEWPDADNNVIIWKTESVVVQVFTDSGLKGLGGCSRYNVPAEMKEYLDNVVKPIIIGKNPFDVEYLAGGISASRARGVWSGVDVALWDIIGKAKGLPLYKLLATDTEPQTHLRVYASGGEFTWLKGSRFPGPDDLIRQARSHKEAGYTAFKYRPGGGFGKLGITIKEFIPYIRRIREAVGPNFDLMQEANTRWSMEQCREIAPVLEELKFTWFEEPLRKNIENYVELKKYLPTVKISGGEGVPNRSGLVEWMDRGAYDIVQPGCDDAGMTECWYMARMAHTRGKLICPHNWQDGLVCVANAHVMAAVPNRFLLESNMTPNPFKEGLFKEKFAVKNGYIDVPEKPGLGVELREGLEELYPPIPGPWNIPDPQMPK